MNHIELFAGCGGLSLGLETNGFELLLANELSPMASETFAYNHLHVDLSDPELEPPEKVYWLSSNFPRNNIKERLRENPNDTMGTNGKYHDLLDVEPDQQQLRRSLLVGSVVDLNALLDSNPPLKEAIKGGLGDGEIDLVSGGPPCQSFSMAGLRQHNNQRNRLPLEFATFVDKVRPKIALLENVSGILRAFNVDGEKHHAWFEVAKVFACKGYVPICIHVNAKYVGTAQNRPRFIMIALRKDIAEKLRKSRDVGLNVALEDSFPFFADVQKNIDPDYEDLHYYDIEKNRSFFENSSIFSKLLVTRNSDLASVENAIDDLRLDRKKESDYVKLINSSFDNRFSLPANKKMNHERRKNNMRVRARFYLYQTIRDLGKEASREVSSFMKSLDKTALSTSTIKKLLSCEFKLISGETVVFRNSSELLKHIRSLHTKKQTQRALSAKMPAPAALSIPDDACHYHKNELRTLTVREMARIQSFPDWFIFRSKVTTGGQMRKFEVPQYTQVGNAVPPLLGLALGEVCANLIRLAY